MAEKLWLARDAGGGFRLFEGERPVIVRGTWWYTHIEKCQYIETFCDKDFSQIVTMSPKLLRKGRCIEIKGFSVILPTAKPVKKKAAAKRSK